MRWKGVLAHAFGRTLPIVSGYLGRASRLKLFLPDVPGYVNDPSDYSAPTIDTTGAPWLIDTVQIFPQNEYFIPRTEARGRAAAAFARVACRQLGFRSAPAVLNCESLALLFRAQQQQ